MSLRCMVAVLERYPADGGPGEKLLALCLADNAHDDGSHIYPSVASMAERSLQSVRTVQSQLARMQALGWLQLVRAGGGRGRPAQYRINPEWLKGASLAPFPAVDKSAETPQITTRNPATGDTETPQTTTQNPATGDTPYRTTRNLSLNHPPTPHAVGGTVDCGLQDLLAAYPASRCDTWRATVVWARLGPNAQLAAEIVEAARTLARTSEWQREEGRFAPKLSKWLRNRGWMIVRPAVVVQPLVVAHAAPVLSDEERALQAEQAQAARERLAQLRQSLRRQVSAARAGAVLC